MKIVVNSKSTGKFRTEVINNRPHIVTEMVSIEGDSVMNGLFYSIDEVNKSYSQLDSLPAPAGHPKVNGKNVSAYHPLATNAHNVGGFVRAPKIVGNQVINELVFDIEVANKDDRGKEIVNRIKSGSRIGVSTGLDAKISNSGGDHSGKPYRGAVSDIKFDHVAVLLNEVPAGESTFTINENESILVCEMASHKHECATCKQSREVSNNHQEVITMDKEKLVLSIIGNSANSYTMADKDALLSMSEDAIVNALHGKVSPTVEQAQKVIKDAGMTINAADFDKEGYKCFIENKKSFDEFLAKGKKEKEEKIKKITDSSKMTAEQVNSMSDAGIDALLESLVPVQNYSVAGGLGAVNHRESSGSVQLHEDA